MMSIGMHCRIVGKPGRLRGLQRFLDHVQSHDKVWVCRRIDIAEHWRNTFPATGGQGYRLESRAWCGVPAAFAKDSRRALRPRRTAE